jgi:hypothetical protein
MLNKERDEELAYIRGEIPVFLLAFLVKAVFALLHKKMLTLLRMGRVFEFFFSFLSLDLFTGFISTSSSLLSKVGGGDEAGSV